VLLAEKAGRHFIMAGVCIEAFMQISSGWLTAAGLSLLIADWQR
jgi:hypothetical protein